jgi:glycosyltransferase involved in cell wall biosynthesis
MAVKQSIAFVANTSWSIYKFRLYLIQRLLQEGFNVSVLAPRDPYTEKFEQLKGLTYIELHHFHGKSISPLQDYLLYRELLNHYTALKPRLIFHYTIKANLYGTRAAARAGIPSICVITGLGYTFAGKGFLQQIVKSLYRRVLPLAKEVWVLNEDDRRILSSQALVATEKLFILPGEGVDTTEFFPDPYEPRGNEITFLFIGRMLRHKGVFEFVEAIQRLKQQGLAIRCQLLGFFDDNPASIPRARIEEWNRQGIITYLGHTDQVASFIKQADCIVLPSYYQEGMPLSLLEGASMCKALIATDTAGCRAIVEEGVNGYLCREMDAADLAQKMAAYYHLPAEAKRQMGIEGRNRVLQNYTREIVAGIYLDKIHRLQE